MRSLITVALLCAPLAACGAADGWTYDRLQRRVQAAAKDEAQALAGLARLDSLERALGDSARAVNGYAVDSAAPKAGSELTNDEYGRMVVKALRASALDSATSAQLSRERAEYKRRLALAERRQAIARRELAAWIEGN